MNIFNEEDFFNCLHKFYYKEKKIYRFNFIDFFGFYNYILPNVFLNAGGNFTYTNSYNLINYTNDFKGKVFIIKDVHENFHNFKTPYNNPRLGIIKIKRLIGFMADFKKEGTSEEYFLKTLGKKKLKQIERNIIQLKLLYDFKFEVIENNITEIQNEIIFSKYIELLKIRYEQKNIKIPYSEKYLSFQKSLFYQLINKGKAHYSLIYIDKKIVAVAMYYNSMNSYIGSKTVFDLNYRKFGLGFILFKEEISRCYALNIFRLDFSKGFFSYKNKLCNHIYYFEYHILFDRYNILCILQALILKNIYLLIKLKDSLF